MCTTNKPTAREAFATDQPSTAKCLEHAGTLSGLVGSRARTVLEYIDNGGEVSEEQIALIEVVFSPDCVASGEETDEIAQEFECENCVEPKRPGEDTCEDCYEDSFPMQEKDVLAEWSVTRAVWTEQYGEEDEIALREGFNEWTDTLCKDGQISPELYNSIDNPE